MSLEDETRRLYESLRQSPVHGPFIEQLEGWPRRPRAVKPGTVVAIAPAALYREYRKTGADGKRLRDAGIAAGLPTETIPLEPTGSLEQNARILLQWLRDAQHEHIILASLSKGGADVKKALSLDASAFRNVSTWISVGGLLHGTPLARWLLSNERFPLAFRSVNRIAGVSFRFLEDLDRRPGGPLDFALTVPPHLRVIHILGFALPEHATNWLSRKFQRKLAPLGPNDGFMLLDDLHHWPGFVYPLWGADHYFRTREDPGPLMERLLCMAADPAW
ncbi:MAG TPA: hypothetical protein VJZ00_02390 [Thermoanaerobaculia bacterium]|nr:hypothetical protein [Thermoanaerobaculia bacterium]